MWIIVILVVLGVCIWGVVDSLIKESRKKPDRIFAEKYGHTPQELVEIIHTSPIVDQIVNIVVQSSYPQEVYIHTDYIALCDSENPCKNRRIYFKELNCSELPNSARFRLALAEAIKDKLPSFYVLREYEYDYWLEVKKEEKKEDYTIKGW